MEEGNGSGRFLQGLIEDSDLAIADIRTLILLKDQEIEKKTYTVSDGAIVNTYTYHRYRYHMWAFDIKTGGLGAYAGRLHLEVEQGCEVFVIPAGRLLFAADAQLDLLVAAQLVQA
jgi:hypothetical protein